jgi:hypothetical protein
MTCSKKFSSFAPQARNLYIYLPHVHQMISAPEEFDHDFCDISAILEAPWRMTAELNEMVQYFRMDYIFKLSSKNAIE